MVATNKASMNSKYGVGRVLWSMHGQLMTEWESACMQAMKPPPPPPPPHPQLKNIWEASSILSHAFNIILLGVVIKLNIQGKGIGLVTFDLYPCWPYVYEAQVYRP